MFLRFLKKSSFPTKLAASAFHTSLLPPYKMPKATIDFSLLSTFAKSKTLQALNQVHQATLTQQNVFNPLDFKIIDKTGSTSYSQTFRAYDKESNVLFAQKKIFLESDSSWNQLNLILKQYTGQSPYLASIYSLNFDEKNQEVKILSQVNQNIISDYSQFMERKSLKWTDEELMSYTQQIRLQFRALSFLNAHCEGPINPENMFIDDKSNNLKVFDFCDFHVGTENFERENSDRFLGSALHTLVQILNPDVPVRNIEEAKSYLSRAHHSFYNKIQENLYLDLDTKSYPRSGYDAFICKKLGLTECSDRIDNETNMAEKEQEENLRYWKKVQENFAEAELKAQSFFDKLMVKISRMLFNITAKIFNPIKARKIAEVSKAVAWLFMYVVALFGFLGFLYFCFVTFGFTILETLVYAFWPSLATSIATTVKEAKNTKQNNDKQDQEEVILSLE